MQLLSYQDLVRLGVVRSRETLRRWLKADAFPKPIKIGRRIAWHQDQIDAWIEQITKRGEG